MARTIEQRFSVLHAGAINAAGAPAQIPFDAADEELNTWGFVLDATDDEIDIPEDGKYWVNVEANINAGAATTINWETLRDPGTGAVTAGDVDVNLNASATDRLVFRQQVTLFRGDAISFIIDPGAATVALTDTRIDLVRVGNTGD